MIEIILSSYVFILGLIVGSFLNVCIYRIPRKESIIKPPSACTTCGVRLKMIDLIPVFSYIFLKGKCRFCKEKVSIKYPCIEILTGVIYLLLFYRFGLTTELLATAFLMSILVIVFFIDLKHFIIPNELVLAAIVGGIVTMIYNLFYPIQLYGDSIWWNPLMGMFVGFGFLFVVSLIVTLLYKTEDAMGMGDVKIFAPIGLFLGWRMTLLALFSSFFIGAVISVILVVLRIKKRQDTIPFGPFIVAGTFITMMYGKHILSWYEGLFHSVF